MNKIHLIIGGARSGKSSLAEHYAKSSHLPVTYIATAQALDEEMQQRIMQHQAERPEHWQLIESPLGLAQAMSKACKTQSACILVDCLTLWLSNCLCQPNTSHDKRSDCNLTYWQQEKQQLLTLLENIKRQEAVQQQNIEIILVSNEVGHGIVPMGELSRQFVDQAGWLHQAIANIADKVEFVMAGLPLTLKPSGVANTKAKP
ncbi:MAG: bifunctional adenosylcobinamide kinase/adenosylcobinamide-phosphate guanylyltransferase [Colwellia sp.]|nr:bifunctional adenosylcobinamide kinase/adenosylcobinamide-phosphate guanylyltransferase [Colwellia sp.]MCW8866334.1 bifunctional adenosylcobinamide kinase/adenosylcobinamide-phosphate guanylyltransferase [Colwellia sp.]MCW9083095.1 bifunctional adenosylcobinamide kinase/adenosylcobinamide-phosphate guanylyltransferase [Colwellia sp.]